MTRLFSFLLFISISFSAFALDTTQATTLRTAALAEPSIAQAITNGDDSSVANWFNASSTFIVWKTVLQEVDVLQSDGFNFSLVDGLTAGKRDEWSNFIFREGKCNPSKANIRAGFLDIWSGTAGKTAVYNAIIDLSKRAATNAEKALATGTGTTATPGVLAYEGKISTNDVSAILRP